MRSGARTAEEICLDTGHHLGRYDADKLGSPGAIRGGYPQLANGLPADLYIPGIWRSHSCKYADGKKEIFIK